MLVLDCVTIYATLYFSTAITCPAISAPANGQVSFATDTTAPYDFATVATYTCDTGYGLAGDAIRSCGGDMSNTTGVWSGAAPTCEGIHLYIHVFLLLLLFFTYILTYVLYLSV